MYQFSLSYFAQEVTKITIFVNDNAVDNIGQENGPDYDEENNSNSYIFTHILSQGDKVSLKLTYIHGDAFIDVHSYFPITFLGTLVSENI